uniref:Uncharacterized protein n=1 Tax=Rhipicephalus microplus TaxID=6941 RepID=A0A6M2CVG9_RHIMP
MVGRAYQTVSNESSRSRYGGEEATRLVNCRIIPSIAGSFCSVSVCSSVEQRSLAVKPALTNSGSVTSLAECVSDDCSTGSIPMRRGMGSSSPSSGSSMSKMLLSLLALTRSMPELSSEGCDPVSLFASTA